MADRHINMCIYKITNTLNNKVYIGQTRNEVKIRWGDHKSSSKSVISKAIKKYGKDNFKYEVIDLCETFVQLNHKEVFWISFYNSLSPSGYNLNTGGNNPILSEEARLRCSHPHTEETKQLLSKLASIQMSKPENREYISKIHKGKKHSTETIHKRSNALSGLITVKNSSGMVGVQITDKYCIGIGKSNGKHIAKKYSISTNGFYEALCLAIEFRNTLNTENNIKLIEIPNAYEVWSCQI
jgi:group I intron endonuclease